MTCILKIPVSVTFKYFFQFFVILANFLSFCGMHVLPKPKGAIFISFYYFYCTFVHILFFYELGSDWQMTLFKQREN